MSALVVSGTGTGVGKTVVTAALAALALDLGRTVAVVKPAQTGVRPDEPGDLAEVGRLAGVGPADVHELARFAAALSPEAAARAGGPGTAGPSLDAVADAVDRLTDQHDLVLVEGAGGLLVRFADDGWTVADLAARLQCAVLVVALPGLGTLNHTALTLESLQHREIALAGLVLGTWPVPPDLPGLAERSNVRDLEHLAGVPLAGAVAAGAGALGPDAFRQVARAGLSPAFGGTFDAADFRRSQGPERDGR